MSKLMTKPMVYEVNKQEVKLSGKMVKEYLTSGNGEVTDQEVVMFMNLCKYQQLNPFLNEAYLVKFGNKPAQIIVSKEAFMKRAEAHTQYEGFEAGIIVDRNGELVELEGAIKLKSDKLVGGWAKVYRKDRKMPVTVKISFEEFSKGQATWNQMPLNMIRKSAIVNAQREAFPETLGAMYTEDDADVTRDVTEEVQEDINQNANKEIIDFEDVEKAEAVDAKEWKNEPRTDNSLNYARELTPDEEVEQEALFNNLNDVREEVPEEPEF